MKYYINPYSENDLISDLVIFLLFKDTDYQPKNLGAAKIPQNITIELSESLAFNDFKAESRETMLFHSPAKSVRRILLAGLGERKSVNAETLRELGALICEKMEPLSSKNIHLILNDPFIRIEQQVAALVEGIGLADYSYTEFKGDINKPNVARKFSFMIPPDENLVKMRRVLKRQLQVVASTNLARTLANKPANHLTPAILAREAKAAFRQSKKVQLKVYDDKDIAALKMNAFLGVARGSSEKPKLIEARYKPGGKKRKRLVLIGKGITFDSGGISIKPSAHMEEMKYDMAGAAAVIGIMKFLDKLQPKLDVIGLIPAAENMPDARSIKPGDVITAFNGKTIEIINTDAEGRLLLADVLAFAVKKYRPDWIIDLATLTGSVVVALGNQATGLFSNDSTLSASLIAAGEDSGDRVWPMPLWPEYKKELESDTADLKNVGGRYAGSITAAKFLEEFVDGRPWAHLDIAGTAYNQKEKAYFSKTATGAGVRLLINLISKLSRAVDTAGGEEIKKAEGKSMK